MFLDFCQDASCGIQVVTHASVPGTRTKLQMCTTLLILFRCIYGCNTLIPQVQNFSLENDVLAGVVQTHKAHLGSFSQKGVNMNINKHGT